VRAIAEAMGYRGEYVRAPQRQADVRRHCADVTRAGALLGEIAPTPLGKGMAQTIAWYRGQQA